MSNHRAIKALAEILEDGIKAGNIDAVYSKINTVYKILKEEAESPCEQCAGMEDKAKDIICELIEYHCFNIKDFFPKDFNDT